MSKQSKRIVRTVVEGEYGLMFRLTFRGRTLEGVSAVARLSVNGVKSERPATVVADNGEGAGSVSIVFQDGELAARGELPGRTEVELVLFTSVSEEVYPRRETALFIVRKNLE